MSVMMRIYKTLFSESDEDVRAIITEVQAVARLYSSEYTNPPLPPSNTSLDEIINQALEFDPQIELDEVKRAALVNLLVNYHDLQALKPWEDSAIGTEEASSTAKKSGAGGARPPNGRVMVW